MGIKVDREVRRNIRLGCMTAKCSCDLAKAAVTAVI